SKIPTEAGTDAWGVFSSHSAFARGPQRIAISFKASSCPRRRSGERVESEAQTASGPFARYASATREASRSASEIGRGLYVRGVPARPAGGVADPAARETPRARHRTAKAAQRRPGRDARMRNSLIDDLEAARTLAFRALPVNGGLTKKHGRSKLISMSKGALT